MVSQCFLVVSVNQSSGSSGRKSLEGVKRVSLGVTTKSLVWMG